MCANLQFKVSKFNIRLTLRYVRRRGA